jgi:S1-C subfamily serine protease
MRTLVPRGADEAMKRRIVRAALVGIVAVVLVQPAGLLAQRREVQPVERVAAITRPAVVYLEVFWEGWLRDERDGLLWLKDAVQTGATCSGSLITPNGYVLTAGHCVEAELVIPDLVQGVVDAYVAREDERAADPNAFYDEVMANSTAEGPGDAGAPLVPKITVYRGIVEKGERAGDDFVAKVVDELSFANSKGDTAILKLDGAKGLPTMAISDETEVGVGTPIVAIGYPGSVSQIVDPTLEPTFKDGTVSAQRTQAGIPFYEVSAASTPGMSGGPVVDLEGEMIGIVSQAPAQESQSFNLMVSASVAEQLMRKNKVRPQRGPTDATYRQGLEQLFKGEFTDSIASFDKVLKADPKHQQAFEIKQQAVKRRTQGGDASGGGFPIFALLPLLIGIAGVVTTVVRKRRAVPVAASASGAPLAPPPPPVATPAPYAAVASSAPPATPAAPIDPLVCSRCGNVHQREVTFCVKCGNPMTAGAVPAASPSTPHVSTAPAVPAKSSSRDRYVLVGSVAAVAVAAVLFLVSRGGEEPSLLPTPAATTSAAPRAEGPAIEGEWASSFGPVTLEHGRISSDLDPVDVSGSWIQGPDKVGEITSGTFDPGEGVLEIAYTQPWDNTEGTAVFALSKDGNTLDGTYEQKGVRGAWTLTR